MAEKKSPIKAPLLRNPGQGLDEKISEVIEEEVLHFILLPALFAILMILEWFQWITDTSVHPLVPTVLFLGSLGYSYYRIIKVRGKLRRLKQGRDGEKAVGQYLDSLRDGDCRVFHDVTADGFNIDHVIVSSRGVFAIETKTYSKPQRGEAVITHKPDILDVNGEFQSGRELVQTKASANWVRNFYRDSLGRKLVVKPVLLFPGWYIKNEGPSDVWVLEPKAFASYFENTPVVLSKDEVATFSNALSRYIRDSVKFA